MDDAIRSLAPADVCIVGAGPAGLTTALALGSAGRTVILLESGGFRSSRRAEELNEGDHEGDPYQGLVRTRHRQVGGVAHIWNVEVGGEPAAKYVPLSRRDVADWPIGWDELEPCYRQAQTLCGLGPFEYGADRWATEARRPFRLEGTGLTSGVYQFGSARRFTRDLVSRLQSTDSVTLVDSATVVGLVADGGGRRLRGVRAARAHDPPFDVKARSVVLACGAVENARLLLLSGLGLEGGGWLGRGFMEHARDFSLVLVPPSPEIFAQASFYDLHSSDDGTMLGGRLGPTDDALDSFHLPNASMTLVPRARRGPRRSLLDRMIRSVRGAADPGAGARGRYGWSRRPAPSDGFDAFKIVLNLEQRPLRSNRIELSRRNDRFGNPLPRLVLRWTDEEQADLERFRELLEGWFRTAGLGRLLVTRGRRPDLSAHHHAGTTRMGCGPHDAVVDAEGRVFGVENLHVAGASAFPTAGFANPTLTIVAMALRLAQHVDASLG